MMTATGTTTLFGIAAEAALAVPGVAGLQPRLAHRLAAAASPTRTGTTPHRTPPEAGIRADRAPDGAGWHIDVRCVLAEGHGVLVTARSVHDGVRNAVISHLAACSVVEPVTVAVTVTGIAARPDAP
ncbi:hypothetical protein ACFC8N_40945 [Streptomyces sp. NPDC055966]|uniref:hypothetical protein n=1 Tax=unclassified Streptomyces TaxID=2593676 RepID=UPI0035DA3C9A